MRFSSLSLVLSIGFVSAPGCAGDDAQAPASDSESSIGADPGDDMEAAAMCIAKIGDCSKAAVPGCAIAYRDVSCTGTGACNTRQTGSILYDTACARYNPAPKCVQPSGADQEVACYVNGAGSCVYSEVRCDNAATPACALPAGVETTCVTALNPPCTQRRKRISTECTLYAPDYCYSTANAIGMITCQDG